MTGKEAKKILETNPCSEYCGYGDDGRPACKCLQECPTKEATMMAIKALEQEPSDDCVSRKALLDMAKSYNTDGYDSYTPLVVDVEDIEALPPVTPTPKWISVSERLPTKEECITNNGLFIVSDGNRTYAEYFDIYNSMKYFGEPTMNGFRVDRCVTSWMPLPEPYKAEMDGE